MDNCMLDKIATIHSTNVMKDAYIRRKEEERAKLKRKQLYEKAAEKKLNDDRNKTLYEKKIEKEKKAKEELRMKQQLRGDPVDFDQYQSTASDHSPGIVDMKQRNHSPLKQLFVESEESKKLQRKLQKQRWLKKKKGQPERPKFVGWSRRKHVKHDIIKNILRKRRLLRADPNKIAAISENFDGIDVNGYNEAERFWGGIHYWRKNKSVRFETIANKLSIGSEYLKFYKNEKMENYSRFPPYAYDKLCKDIFQQK